MSVEGNAFTLRYPDASMRATFVTPQDAKVVYRAERVAIGTARKGFHATPDRVKATGGDSYFVVMTFQRGDAPKVAVEGAGLDAKVTVGGRTVRFDGWRIVIGRGRRCAELVPVGAVMQIG